MLELESIVSPLLIEYLNDKRLKQTIYYRITGEEVDNELLYSKGLYNVKFDIHNENSYIDFLYILKEKRDKYGVKLAETDQMSYDNFCFYVLLENIAGINMMGKLNAILCMLPDDKNLVIQQIGFGGLIV